MSASSSGSPPSPRRSLLPSRSRSRSPSPSSPAELLGPAGAWNIVALERLVAERGSEFPDRVEEWQAYLFFLREHASMEGALPPSFDALVDDAFHELLA